MKASTSTGMASFPVWAGGNGTNNGGPGGTACNGTTALGSTLRVMDTTALSLCMDNKLSIYVFELADGNIGRVIAGEKVGTVIETQ